MAEQVELPRAHVYEVPEGGGRSTELDQRVEADVMDPEWTHGRPATDAEPSLPPEAPYVGLRLPGAGPNGGTLLIVLWAWDLLEANVHVEIEDTQAREGK